MSQPPFLPAGPQRAAPPAPAAPTQLGFPGQLPVQPQYMPTPDQVRPQQFATGFPNYLSPPPSPRSRTKLLVSAAVCLVVLLFALVGFLLVA